MTGVTFEGGWIIGEFMLYERGKVQDGTVALGPAGTTGGVSGTSND